MAGLVICACAFGFISSVAPTTNECIFIITGPELFNFSYGQATVFMGIGWVAGAPAAGSVATVYKTEMVRNLEPKKLLWYLFGLLLYPNFAKKKQKKNYLSAQNNLLIY